MRAIYGQWTFRNPEQLAIINSTLKDHGINSQWFRQYEKFYIATILNDYKFPPLFEPHNVLTFNETFENIKTLVSPYDTEVLCGYLPKTGGWNELISQFLILAGYEALPHDQTKANQNKNPSFHPLLIESIAIAMEHGLLSSLSPHKGNDELSHLSGVIAGQMTTPTFDTTIENAASDYTAAFFASSNTSFFEKHGIPESICPQPRSSDYPASKEDFLKQVLNVQAERIQQPDEFLKYIKTCTAASSSAVMGQYTQ